MKRNHFKPLNVLLFVFLCALVESCNKQTDFTVFDKNIAISNAPIYSAHDKRFLQVTNLKTLDYVLVHNLSDSAMLSTTQAVLGKNSKILQAGKLISIYFYTTNTSRKIPISRDLTHALSIIGKEENGLNHYYFEKQADNTFKHIQTLHIKLDNLLSMDEVRMLHFASTTGTQLPEKSTVFELRSSQITLVPPSTMTNTSLMKTILLDLDRNKGYQTIGLYGDELYRALRKDDAPGKGNCGNAENCPPGGEGTCVPVSTSDGAGYQCIKGGGGGCVTAELPIVIHRMNFRTRTPINFVAIHSFRDKFLSKSLAGKKYISYMYIFSQFAKRDINSINKYIAIIQPLQESITKIMSGNHTDIVLTKELSRQAKEIIRSHREVKDKDFQNILNIMEKDIDRLTGLNKTRFISEFENTK
ncbi:MAG: hypothetical protein OEZ39_17105 [Gammaproteobacteria bacterium]|nr:hypothetical protein [Gammaproteobacteria bacterium]MDH5653581.1 hypothetical protein [Gammaproteobacteria bacterium]